MLLNEDVAMNTFAPSNIAYRKKNLETLRHPAAAYRRPIDAMKDSDLTTNEKRAILASWASDACAVEAAPSLRSAPGNGRPVSIDEILDALRALESAWPPSDEVQPPVARFAVGDESGSGAWSRDA
jgi:hypothetical protein